METSQNWQIEPSTLRLYQQVKIYEISIQAVNGGNEVSVSLLPEREVLENQFVPGTTLHDARRALRLGNQLVKQIKNKEGV